MMLFANASESIDKLSTLAPTGRCCERTGAAASAIADGASICYSSSDGIPVRVLWLATRRKSTTTT